MPGFDFESELLVSKKAKLAIDRNRATFVNGAAIA